MEEQLRAQILYWQKRNTGRSNLRILLSGEDYAELSRNDIWPQKLTTYQGIELLVVPDMDKPLVVCIPH